MTRMAVAARLGRTISGVRHMEGKELHPRKIDGVWTFDPREVEAVARRLGHALSSGEIAARACELFREGKDVVDVVVALRQPFEVVLALQRMFVLESGSFIVPRVIADQLAELCKVPKATPEILVEAFEQRDRNLDELSARLHKSRVNT
jgi:hypothetical protein